MPPTSLMWPGHDMAMPWAVPPKWDGTCFTHLNGVLIAQAQDAAKCGNVLSDPQNGYQSSCAFTLLNGVLIAQAQDAAKCGNVLSDPQNGYQSSCTFTHLNGVLIAQAQDAAKC